MQTYSRHESSAASVVQKANLLCVGASALIRKGDAYPVKAVSQFMGDELVDFSEPWLIVV
jgi:hypothetical protein